MLSDRTRQPRIRVAGEYHQVVGNHLHLHLRPYWLILNGSPLSDFTKLAGEEGFEPSSAGIKIRCLNQLGDSPKKLELLQLNCLPHRQWMLDQLLDGPTAPPLRHIGGCQFRLLFRSSRHKYRGARARHPRDAKTLETLDRFIDDGISAPCDGFEIVNQ